MRESKYNFLSWPRDQVPQFFLPCQILYMYSVRFEDNLSGWKYLYHVIMMSWCCFNILISRNMSQPKHRTVCCPPRHGSHLLHAPLPHSATRPWSCVFLNRHIPVSTSSHLGLMHWAFCWRFCGWFGLLCHVVASAFYVRFCIWMSQHRGRYSSWWVVLTQMKEEIILGIANHDHTGLGINLHNWIQSASTEASGSPISSSEIFPLDTFEETFKKRMGISKGAVASATSIA